MLMPSFSGTGTHNIAAPKMNTSLFKEEVAEQRYKYTWRLQAAPGPASRFRAEAFPSARFRDGEWNQIHSISLDNEVNTLVNLTSPHCSCKCPKWELSGTLKSHGTGHIFRTPTHHMAGGNASDLSLSSPGVFSA